MATQAVRSQASTAPQTSLIFEKFASLCALLTGLSGFFYAVAFIILRNALLSALFLSMFGLLSTAALVAVYRRLQQTDRDFALWALILGMIGSLGAASHGGYDLATVLHPPTTSSSGLPNAIDPRGLLTFGVAGIALMVIAWLIGRGNQLPRGLSYLGYVSAILLVVLYVGRLTILDAASPIILGPAIINGFLIQPAWYIWLGLALRRTQTG